MNRLSRWPSSFGRVSRRGRRQGRLEGGTGRKRSVAPEGYVWVLSRHIPFYHASGLRCPRSRCQENGRIFPLRGELGLGRERETRAESIRGGGGGGSRVEGEGGERETGRERQKRKGGKHEGEAGVGGFSEGSLTRLARRPAPRCYQPRPQTPIHGHFGGSPQFLAPPTLFTLSWTAPRDPLFQPGSTGIPREPSGFAIIPPRFPLTFSLLRLRLLCLLFSRSRCAFSKECQSEITVEGI